MVVTGLMDTIRRAQPQNQHLVSLSVQLKAMIAANPEKLHSLIGDYVVRPHLAEIMAADDSFISKLESYAGDLLGLGSCYANLELDDRASVLYGLIQLAKILG